MRPENNTKKMCFYKFVATLLLSLTHKTSKTLQINRLHQIKNILHRELYDYNKDTGQVTFPAKEGESEKLERLKRFKKKDNRCLMYIE